MNLFQVILAGQPVIQDKIGFEFVYGSGFGDGFGFDDGCGSGSGFGEGSAPAYRSDYTCAGIGDRCGYGRGHGSGSADEPVDLLPYWVIS